jgi:hypothetical protein
VLVSLGAPARVGKLIAASADAHRPPGRQSAPPGEDRRPAPADFQAMRDAYAAVAAGPAHFDEFAAKNSATVHQFPGWTDELRSLQAPTLLIFGDRDFSPLPEVAEMFELLPDAQLAVLPGTTHVGVTRRPGEVLALVTPFLLVAGQLPPICPDPVEELEHGLVTAGEVRTCARPRLVPQDRPRALLRAALDRDGQLRVLPGDMTASVPSSPGQASPQRPAGVMP